MGNAFITRRGGTGGGANFSIRTASSAPTGTGKPNEIVVISTVPITEVYFIADYSWTPSVGTVVIQSATSYSWTGANLNLLKNDYALLSPTGLKQYTSAGWVMRDAYIYHDNDHDSTKGWVKFSTSAIYIIKNGVVQSGYSFSRIVRSGSNCNTSSSGGIYTVSTQSSTATTGLTTSSTVNMSKSTKLYIQWSSATKTTNNYVMFGRWNSGTATNESGVYSAWIGGTGALASGGGTTSLDISSISSSYIGFFFKLDSQAVSIGVKNIWMT